MSAFEGYPGLRVGIDRPVDDAVFVLMVSVAVIFAVVFRSNFLHFLRMLKDVRYVRERHNLFDPIPGRHVFFFRSYMLFQVFLLCGIGMFAYTRARGLVTYRDWWDLLLVVGVYTGLFFVFYLVKQLFHILLAFAFTTQQRYRLWLINYNAVVELWGLTLYLPVYWMVIVGGNVWIPVIMLCFSYVLCRLVIVYKTMSIFWHHRNSFLYISLYLCALEILPLMYLYEGMVLLYNLIETSTLWH